MGSHRRTSQPLTRSPDCELARCVGRPLGCRQRLGNFTSHYDLHRRADVVVTKWGNCGGKVQAAYLWDLMGSRETMAVEPTRRAGFGALLQDLACGQGRRPGRGPEGGELDSHRQALTASAGVLGNPGEFGVLPSLPGVITGVALQVVRDAAA
jgi:hypothetical protein